MSAPEKNPLKQHEEDDETDDWYNTLARSVSSLSGTDRQQG